MYFSRAISCTFLPKGGHYGSYCPAVCTVGGKYFTVNSVDINYTSDLPPST